MFDGQIPPWRTGTHQPEDRIEKPPMANRAYRLPGLFRQQQLCTRPLLVRGGLSWHSLKKFLRILTLSFSHFAETPKVEDFAGRGLSPSFHEGSVSSILAEGGILQYDAQTDHGNSGSPLFDVDSGTVYGLVRAGSTGETGALQNNFAITIPMLIPFLQNAHAPVSYVNGSAKPSGTTTQQNTNLPNVAGTYVGSLYDTMAGNGAFTVTLLQDGKTLAGTWAAEFSSNRNYNDSGEGASTAVVGPNSAAFYLLPSVSNFCPYLATVVVGNAALKGTYASHNCTVANGGSFTAQRTDSAQQRRQGEQSTPNTTQSHYVLQAKSTGAVAATTGFVAQPGSVAAGIDLRMRVRDNGCLFIRT